MNLVPLLGKCREYHAYTRLPLLRVYCVHVSMYLSLRLTVPYNYYGCTCTAEPVSHTPSHSVASHALTLWDFY